MKSLTYSLFFALPLMFAHPQAYADKHNHGADKTAVTCEKCAKKDKAGRCGCEQKGECTCGESCDCKSCADKKK